MSIMNNMKGMPDPWIEPATSCLADERLTSYDTPLRAIQPHLNNSPLNKLVALGHFLTQQKRNILYISQKHDPTIQLLYQISKDKFENECEVF
jgi:hypothetical protein